MSLFKDIKASFASSSAEINNGGIVDDKHFVYLFSGKASVGMWTFDGRWIEDCLAQRTLLHIGDYLVVADDGSEGKKGWLVKRERKRKSSTIHQTPSKGLMIESAQMSPERKSILPRVFLDLSQVNLEEAMDWLLDHPDFHVEKK